MTHHLLYRIAAFAILVSALLHVMAPFLGGFDVLGTFLLVAGLIYLPLGLLLSRHKRWAAWLTFLMLLFGIIIAFAYFFGGSAIPGWMFGAIAVSEVIAFLALFAILWRNKPVIA